jgi:hypothetical protein
LKRGRPTGSRSPFSFGGIGDIELANAITDQISTSVRDKAPRS